MLGVGLGVALGLLLEARPALAASPSSDIVELRPPTWDMTREELEAIGLGQWRGDPIPVPPEYMPVETTPTGTPQGVQNIIFVNFDGAQLTAGSDDSRQNRTQIGELAGTFAPYGDGTKREAVMQAVRQDWTAYNVTIVDERPAAGDYVMNMTGPTNPFGGGVLGIAPLDCEDRQTRNNITYAFHRVSDNFSASTTATTIGQEVAHSFGLEHVDEPGDIMNPFNAGGDPSFRDTCLQIVTSGGGGIVCGSQHADQCGASNRQNSHLELLALFGPSAPDTAAPIVRIVDPSDGDRFEDDADFEIVVEASDDIELTELRLFNGSEQLGIDRDAPYGWNVNGIPAGVYTFSVEAEDGSGNVGFSDAVTVYVGQDAPPPANQSTTGDLPGDTSDEGGDEGSTGDGTGGVPEPAEESDGAGAQPFPPGYGQDYEAPGCATAGRRAARPTFALLVLFVAAARRRSRSSC